MDVWFYGSLLSLPLGGRNIEINVKIITAYGHSAESQCDCITEEAFQQEHVSISKGNNSTDSCRREEIKCVTVTFYPEINYLSWNIEKE